MHKRELHELKSNIFFTPESSVTWTQVICMLKMCGYKISLQSLKENTAILSYGKNNKIQWCWIFINDLCIHKKPGVSKESLNKLAYEFIYKPSWGKKSNELKLFELGEYFTNLFQVQWSWSLHTPAAIFRSSRTASCPSWVTYIAYQQRWAASHLNIYVYIYTYTQTYIYPSEVKSPDQWCFLPPKLNFEFYTSLTDKNETMKNKDSEYVIMGLLIWQC